jgi:hypothetical protein
MKLQPVLALLQTFAWRLLGLITGLQMLTDWHNGDFNICCVAILSIDIIRTKNRRTVYAMKILREITGWLSCLSSFFK